MMITTQKVFIRLSFLKRNLTHYVRMDQVKQDTLKIFSKAVATVEPENLIKNSVKLHKNELIVCDQRYVVKNNCHIVGFGKAVYKMSVAMESILGSHLVSGVVSIPKGTFNAKLGHGIPAENSRIKFIEGAENNLPDANSEHAAGLIKKLIEKLDKDDLLIVLISGGGSALLPFPKPPIKLQEKTELIKLLSNRGADIIELNSVRKILSVLKGGGLAKLAYPTKTLALILSDVIGDPLDYIASGPTTPNADSAEKAMDIIKKYDLDKHLSVSVQAVLNSEIRTGHSFSHVENFVIGNNELAARKARERALELGYQTYIISSAVNGDVDEISHAYSRIATRAVEVIKGLSSKQDFLQCLDSLKTVLNISEEAMCSLKKVDLNMNTKLCLISGGEATVRVKGKGKGGRNQQLALQFAVDLHNSTSHLNDCIKPMNIALLSCGTDGIDGPTDAAGAFGFLQLCSRAQELSLDPLDFINRNDSYHFYHCFESGRYLIKTGHTGTNVMDLHILIIKN